MSQKIISIPHQSNPIGYTDKGQAVYASPELERYLQDILQKMNDNLLGRFFPLTVYAKADLPNPVPAQGLVHVSDEAGGPVPAYADGTDWRRVSDGAIVS